MRSFPAPLESYVASWCPTPVRDDDPLAPAPSAALSACLDLPEPAAGAGDPLPPLWHWLHFLQWPAQSGLGPDGHVRDGGFLPPLPDRRRMFAGGRCRITAPLRLGVPAERVSSLGPVVARHGRSGELLFVTTRHEFRQSGRTCVVEEQDTVYRSGTGSGVRNAAPFDAAPAPRTEGPWTLRIRPDERLLFRFSALTANTHRIHYDAPYCRDVEGYPGLVVHGPLLVLLMLELVRTGAPERHVRSLSYRLRQPVFAGEDAWAVGAPADDGAELRIATLGQGCHATATVAFG
ncbi:MAG TPA: hypothetical protein VN520_11835 [Streptomyces sp.]|uniref:hypothetical protein n=1 Tax=Streptomyces sp. TaxID=1931 RepID=UPI002CF6CF0F|nr:hypothetical protein [Streptomyces sp.]HWU07054.1 hypothetical protein [Streptomyces sp.]